MSWFDSPKKPEPEAPAIATGETLYVAMLAIRYNDGGNNITWGWACNADETYALGAALEAAPRNAVIVSRGVIAIPLASGMEAGTGGGTVGSDPKDDSPPAESGDAPKEVG